MTIASNNKKLIFILGTGGNAFAPAVILLILGGQNKALPQTDDYNRRPNHVLDGFKQNKNNPNLQKMKPPTRLSPKKLIGMPVRILERLDGKERGRDRVYFK